MKFDLAALKDTFSNLGEIAVLVLAGIAAAFTKKIKEFLKSKSAKRLENSIQHNTLIREMLSELRALYDCDRVKLFQFHNGDYFLSGESSMKATMTHYVLNIGVDVPNKVTSSHQNIPTSHLLYTLRAMKDGPFYLSVADEHIDPILEYFFGLSGTKTALFCPIRDVRGNWLGFIACTWLDFMAKDESNTPEVITEYAEKIGVMMSKKF